MLRFFILAFAACTSSFAFAEVKLNVSRPIRIEYSSKAWNKSSSEENTGTILMRDSRTNRFAQIQLVETGPDTAIFIGSYSVSWGESEIIPEVYLPPQDMAKSADSLQKMENMIKEGTLLRKPYFAKSDSKGNNTLMVFDTKEQTLKAFEDYRRVRQQIKTLVTESTFEAQANAALENEMKVQELKSKALENDRKRLAAEERKKIQNLRQEFDSRPLAEQERRKALAEQSAGEGAKLFQQGKFSEAEKSYFKAIEQDPNNSKYLLRYGVTLHRSEKLMRSLVYLDLVPSTEKDTTEKDFYTNLNLMKLKENDLALKGFENLEAKSDKAWSPQAGLYAGIIEFQNEHFDNSKKHFEFVLDNSEDPAIDKLAEAYIEQIANAQAFKKEQARRWVISLTGGLMYDSNILSTANSLIDQQPTDLAGYRWTYSGSIEYRFLYFKEKELSLVLSGNDIYSTDSSFRPQQNFQNTDTLVYSAYLPYKHKGMALGKSYQMTLSPGYEQTRQNADALGDRELILNSGVLKNDHTFGMRDDWYATYAIELRSDHSLIDNSTTPNDDITATKITLGTTQTFFQNQKRTEAWIGEFGLSQNRASGDNASYARVDFAATYMMPWVYDTIFTSRLGYYNANYPFHLIGRTDTNTTLTLGLLKPIAQKLSVSLAGTYTNNQSTLETSDYRKYVIMTVFSWSASL
ncbi:MAG: hypothetical protein ACAH59_00285 [Pseudobdellovibrionaceae bacterium]